MLPTLCLLALPLSAQLASDQVPRKRTVPDSEQIHQELEDSRYALGPIRLRPILGLRDFGYDSNVFGTADNPVSDWRATASAGAHLLVPMGRKIYVRGIANPEYTWYRHLTSRRGFGGDYGGSVLGLFNRLTVEAGAESDKSIQPVSSEELAAALGTRSMASGRAEVDLLHRLSIFAAGQTQKQRYSSSDDQFAALQSVERNDSSVSGGVRYRFKSYLDMAVGAESGRSRFVTGPERDNKTKAAIFGLHYDRPRTFVNLAVGPRQYESANPLSAFPRFSTTTGSYYAEHRFVFPIRFEIYGHRVLQYSVTTSPYFIETRNGLGMTIPIGYRVGIHAFGEAGRNTYAFADPQTNLKRSDRVTSVGGGFLIRVYRKTALVTLATRDRYTSNVPSNDRSLVRVTTVLSLGGDSF